jgi:lipopolysaccharide/colanic/teichoic acid biosynthesis glycosyltransferase
VTALKGVGIDVEVLAMELERMRPLELRRYAGHPTLVVGSMPLGLADLLKKRIFDLAVTVSALLLLAPVFAIVAVAIKLDSEGPILFRQPRLGHGNRIFEMLKFRTMRSEESDAAGQVLTAREDNRVTTVGRFLRRTSLDELPQLINVLTGDMSLVGPRPHALHAKAGRDLYWEVHPGYWLRAAVKPGLTGLAQVRGYRGPTETGKHLIDRVDSDLEYLAGWTLSRDVAIIFQTLRVLVHPNAF